MSVYSHAHACAHGCVMIIIDTLIHGVGPELLLKGLPLKSEHVVLLACVQQRVYKAYLEMCALCVEPAHKSFWCEHDQCKLPTNHSCFQRSRLLHAGCIGQADAC